MHRHSSLGLVDADGGGEIPRRPGGGPCDMPLGPPLWGGQNSFKHNPVPDLRQTVTRLKELWPLRGVVMKPLENLGLKRGGGAMCDGTSEADIVEVRIGALVMGEEPDTGRKIASPSGHPADLLLA